MRFKSDRQLFSLVAIVVSALLFAYAMKFEGFKGISILLKNSFILDIHYSTNNLPDTSIVLVNIAFQEQDSIKKAIEILSKYHPKAIGIDISNFNEDEFLSNFDSSNFVLPFEEHLTKNLGQPDQSNITYGHVNFSGGYEIEKFDSYNKKQIPHFSIELLKFLDSTAYGDILDDSSESFIPSYRRNSSIYKLELYEILGEYFLEPRVNSKVIIMGHLGHSVSMDPSQENCIDAHETPVGLMFGSEILATAFSTLNRNFIHRYRSLNILLVLLNTVILFMIIKKTLVWRPILYFFFIQVVILGFWISYSYSAFVILTKFNCLIDYESLVISTLVLGELSCFYKIGLSANNHTSPSTKP
ncbi:MAG: CHASE2 domain-containing protein [Bacteroidota bacterium]